MNLMGNFMNEQRFECPALALGAGMTWGLVYGMEPWDQTPACLDESQEEHACGNTMP